MTTGAKVGLLIGGVAVLGLITFAIVEMSKKPVVAAAPGQPAVPAGTTTVTSTTETIGGLGSIVGAAAKALV